MYTISCPYSEIELKLALFKVCNIESKEKEIDKVREEIDALGELEDAPSVAKSLGLTPKELVDSPNFAAIMTSRRQHRVEQEIKLIQKGLGVSHVSAWAVWLIAYDKMPM